MGDFDYRAGSRSLHVRHGGDDEAHADFEAAWRVFLSKRTEVDFQEWRDQRDWTARKYAIWKAGERLPSQQPNTIMRCSCGELFDSQGGARRLTRSWPCASAAKALKQPSRRYRVRRNAGVRSR
jgi:hypothetical protein